MKKVIASILSILYLSTSMGATVHMHYCMGRLVAWGLVDRESKDCVSCGMAINSTMPGCSVGMKNCCHDEHKQIKTDKDQKLDQASHEFAKIIPSAALFSYNSWTNPFVASPVQALPAIKGPPLIFDIPVFLRNCNFRI